MNRVQIAITTCGLLLAPIPAMPNGKLYIGANGLCSFLDGLLDEVRSTTASSPPTKSSNSTTANKGN